MRARYVASVLLCTACARDHGTVQGTTLTSVDAGADAGVDGDAAASTAGCVPSLADCYQTRYWADCGGDGRVTFACTNEPATQCLWFPHACVPSGWVSSPCEADDICCSLASPVGKPIDALDDGSFFFFDSHGVEPWSRERALDIAVVERSSLRVTADAVACEGQLGNPALEVCVGGDVAPDVTRFMLDTFNANASVGDSFFEATVLELEVDLALMRARACQSHYSDVAFGECGSDAMPPRCASAGTIELSRLPKPRERHVADIQLHADLTFDPDLHVVLDVAAK